MMKRTCCGSTRMGASQSSAMQSFRKMTTMTSQAGPFGAVSLLPSIIILLSSLAVIVLPASISILLLIIVVVSIIL